MTKAHTIMTALLTRALDAGEVELSGAQLYQGGRPVMPRLVLVADQEPPTSTASAGIRRSAGGQHEENNSTYRNSRRFLRTCWSQPRKRLRTGRAWRSRSSGRRVHGRASSSRHCPRRCWSHGATTIATTTRKVDPPPATLRLGFLAQRPISDCR